MGLSLDACDCNPIPLYDDLYVQGGFGGLPGDDLRIFDELSSGTSTSSLTADNPLIYA